MTSHQKNQLVMKYYTGHRNWMDLLEQSRQNVTMDRDQWQALIKTVIIFFKFVFARFYLA